MKKIAVLVLNEYINDSRVIKESKSLSKLYEVHVFALNNGEFNDIESPERNIKIIRKTPYKKPSNVLFKKAIQLFTFFHYFITCLFFIRKYDAVHCNDLETLPIGVCGKIFKPNLKVIYDAHEYQTETLWMKNKFKKRIAKILEGFLIRYVDRMCVVSESIANAYVKNYGVEKPFLVLNTPPLEYVPKKDKFRKVFDIPKSYNIFLYQGGLTKGRGIELLLETFSTLSKTNHVIVFMGYGNLESLITSYADKFPNIFIHPAVSPDVLLSYTSSADIGISFIEDLCLNYRYCLPNKIFEYLMAGLPVIVSNLVEMKSVVNKYEIGAVTKSNDKAGLLDCINSIERFNYEKLISNVNNVNKKYNWEQQELILFSMYNSLFGT